MPNFLYLDIETIPCQDDEKRKAIVANAKPPANYKKPETIEAWRSENAADLIAKTSFDGGLGHVCQICAIFGEKSFGDFGDKMDHVSKERGFIKAFFDWLELTRNDKWAMPPVIVGHNVNAFDIRFLWQRAICIGVKLPNWFPKDPKPWGEDTFDTMTAWAGSRGTVSLDNLASYLGIEGKGSIDGSMIAGMWAEGRHDEIAAYCMNDVKLVKAIHERMMEAGL